MPPAEAAAHIPSFRAVAAHLPLPDLRRLAPRLGLLSRASARVLMRCSLYSEDGRQSRMQLQWCETGGLRRLSTSCGGDSKAGRLRTGGLRRVATSCGEDGDGENIKTIVHRHRAHGCDSCSLASSAELSRPAARPLTAYQGTRFSPESRRPGTGKNGD